MHANGEMLTSRDIVRFWTKVAIGPTDQCWHWTGKVATNGYGRFSIGVVFYGAHRVSFAIASGDISRVRCSGSDLVLHSCDNRICVNPNHLRLGSPFDNMADAVERGRRRSGPLFGVSNPRAKLTEQQVQQIRRDRRGYRKIAAEYGVGQTTVAHIKTGRTWSHIA